MRCNLGPEIGAFLGDGASDTGSLHLSLDVHDDSSVVLEVKEVTFTSADGLLLSDDDGGDDLLSELGLTLLDGGKEHVSGGTGGESVQLGTDADASDHVEVLGSGVVGAVHDTSDG